jgi:hypothetical protein
LLLPQPKLNCGVTLAGVACNRTVALGTLPPFVHALTSHWSATPRSLVAWERVIWTQRLTFAGLGVGFVPGPVVPVDVAEGEGDGVAE